MARRRKIKKVKGSAVARKVSKWASKKHYSKKRAGRIKGAVVWKIRAERARKHIKHRK